jgi:hypothetical protein
VARYGARPAIWLVGGDDPASAPSVVEQLDRAGQTLEEWDAYRQPLAMAAARQGARLRRLVHAPGVGWREALDFEGSRYPGVAAKIFDGLPFADMQPNWPYSYGRRGLAVPGRLFVLYLPEGGDVAIIARDVPRAYRVFDPRTGKVLSEGRLLDTVPAQAKTGPGSAARRSGIRGRGGVELK